jgi:predicted ATP-dependent protease
LPKRNERDLEDVPEDVRMAIRFVPVEWIDEALDVALVPREGEVGFPGAVGDQGLVRQPNVSLN